MDTACGKYVNWFKARSRSFSVWTSPIRSGIFVNALWSRLSVSRSCINSIALSTLTNLLWLSVSTLKWGMYPNVAWGIKLWLILRYSSGWKPIKRLGISCKSQWVISNEFTSTAGMSGILDRTHSFCYANILVVRWINKNRFNRINPLLFERFAICGTFGWLLFNSNLGHKVLLNI